MNSTTATTTRRLTGGVLAAALAAAALGGAPASAGEPVGKSLAEVRAGTAKYHDVEAAMLDGYAPASPCVPGMGYHYMRGINADAGDLDHTSPEILVYVPRKNGSLKLVAVEYASWDAGAELLGHDFEAPIPDGNLFHTLHAWIWQGNPAGMFSPTNPNVSCG